MTNIELLVLFLALGLGALGGFASAYAVHWVLIHRMRGIDGLLRANYAISKRAETRALRVEQPLPRRAVENLTAEEIYELARKNGMTASQSRGE